jgi:hypothetical protein
MQKVNEYMNKMYVAIGDKLINPESIFSGRDGHLRMAREIGVALADFTEKEQRELFTSSYSSIYVRGCRFKPVLNNNEWIAEMRKGYDKAMEYRGIAYKFMVLK